MADRAGHRGRRGDRGRHRVGPALRLLGRGRRPRGPHHRARHPHGRRPGARLAHRAGLAGHGRGHAVDGPRLADRRARRGRHRAGLPRHGHARRPRHRPGVRGRARHPHLPRPADDHRAGGAGDERRAPDRAPEPVRRRGARPTGGHRRRHRRRSSPTPSSRTARAGSRNLLRSYGLRARAITSPSCSRTGPSSSRSCGVRCASACYVTPINWHLSPDEAAYIVDDCGASVLVASAGLGDVVGRLAGRRSPSTGRVAVGGPLPGFADYDAAARRPARHARPTASARGTGCSTRRARRAAQGHQAAGASAAPLGAPSVVQRCWCRASTAAARTACTSARRRSTTPRRRGGRTPFHRLGGTTVVMERFDPLEVLALIERHRVTHVQFVPTHLVRLMKLPAEERDRFDLSSLRGRRARGRAVPARGEAGRARVARPDRPRVLLGQRGRRASAPSGPRSGSPTPARSAGRCSAPVHIVGPDGAEVPAGRGGRGLVRDARTASSTTATRPRRRPRSTTGAGARSATSAGSTTTATSTSPTGCRT